MSDLNDLIKILEQLREAIDPRSPIFLRRSTGIEVTQAVQYYHSASHLTDASDRAPDNAATLIALKPAIVRAYVRPGFGLKTDTPVGGKLLVERKQGILGPWKEIATLSPWLAPTMTPVDDSYADERGNIWNSLNFRIPASQFAGNMRLTLQLDTGETRTTTVLANLIQTLRVRVILVSYSGLSTSIPPAPGGTAPTNLNLPAPTLADAQTTATLAFRMMPVQQTGSFASAGTLTWTRPLDDARESDGGCSKNWDLLLAQLGKIRDSDGNRADVVYYGLLPTGTPLNVPGCGVGGLGSAAVGDLTTFVHEIGHGYDFQHTPSGNTGPTDPNYPVYEPYPSASIGEYGVDIQSGTMYSPATSTDYMSYGPNRWMSLYQHGRLINNTRLAPDWIKENNPFDHVPVIVNPKPWWWPDPPWERDDIEKYKLNPLISVRGAIDEAGKVRVDSVARITASAVMHGPEINWNAQLVSAAGDDIAARARMTRVLRHAGGGGCGCGCSGTSGPGKIDPNQLPLEFHVMVPDVELGSALRIVDREGKESWARSAPDTPVCFASVEAELCNEDTKVRFTWRLEAGHASDVWAQYSPDDGKTWRGMTVGLCDGSAEVDIAGLPAGRVLVRLLAHDGFCTAASDPVTIKIPELAPYPAILYPAQGELVAANAEFEVLGSAVDQCGYPIDDDCLEWLVDGRPLEHRGRAVSLHVKEGDHKLTLRALARFDAEVTIAFTARAIGR
jgi:hypothetical protein